MARKKKVVPLPVIEEISLAAADAIAELDKNLTASELRTLLLSKRKKGYMAILDGKIHAALIYERVIGDNLEVCYFSSFVDNDGERLLIERLKSDVPADHTVFWETTDRQTPLHNSLAASDFWGVFEEKGDSDIYTFHWPKNSDDVKPGYTSSDGEINARLGID